MRVAIGVYDASAAAGGKSGTRLIAGIRGDYVDLLD